jgi:hypothetical protein
MRTGALLADDWSMDANPTSVDQRHAEAEGTPQAVLVRPGHVALAAWTVGMWTIAVHEHHLTAARMARGDWFLIDWTVPVLALWLAGVIAGAILMALNRTPMVFAPPELRLMPVRVLPGQQAVIGRDTHEAGALLKLSPGNATRLIAEGIADRVTG